jgi:hypothetical protein
VIVDLDRALSSLRHALSTLAEPQGRVARRNARTRVRSAMRVIETLVDATYPTVKAQPKARRAARSQAQVRRDLIADGWVEVATHTKYGTDILAKVAQLRLPIRRTGPANVAVGSSTVATLSSATWIPGWVAHYYPRNQDLLAARSNSKLIVAAKAAVRLGSLQGLIKQGAIQCPSK